MLDSILDENNGYCPTDIVLLGWLMTKDCCGITSSAESSFNYGSEPTQAKTQLGLLSPCLTWNKRGTNLMPSSVTNSAMYIGYYCTVGLKIEK